jgi:citrate lyase gamma subunit
MSESVTKSSIKRFVFNEFTRNAQFITMTPRMANQFNEAVEKTVRDMTKAIEARGVKVIDDERNNA